MRRARSAILLSAWLTMIPARAARLLLALPPELPVRARVVVGPPRSTIGCAGLANLQLRDTWGPRRRLLEDVPDLVSDYESSLALATAGDHEDHNRDCDFASNHEDESFLAHRDVHPHEPSQPPHCCEPCRSARSSDVHLRSAATDPARAPTHPATAADDLRRTLSNPRQGARSTDATRAPPACRCAFEDPQ